MRMIAEGTVGWQAGKDDTVSLPAQYAQAASSTGLAGVESGHLDNGRWVSERKPNGDDVVMNYDLAEAAANNQSGSGLRFSGDGPSVQRVRLYRYR
jgi:beta-galactosidase GanA